MDNASRTWLYAEGCLAEERDELERRIERRTGIYAKCEKTFGPPQYVFAGKLGDIFKTYTGDNPGRHKGGGPFVRFFVEAVKPSDIVRRALAHQKTWDPKATRGAN